MQQYEEAEVEEKIPENEAFAWECGWHFAFHFHKKFEGLDDDTEYQAMAESDDLADVADTLEWVKRYFPAKLNGQTDAEQERFAEGFFASKNH